MMHRANYDYTVIYREKQGGGSTFRFLSPPWCISTRHPSFYHRLAPGVNSQLTQQPRMW